MGIQLEIPAPGGGGGANVKTGIETGISENSERAVSFNTSFSSVPEVVCEFADTSDESSTLSAHTITITGFTIKIVKIGGGGSVNRDVDWIASDSGNA